MFRDSVHQRTDAILVDHPRAGEFIPVAGGWIDAADALQYVTTSATATYQMLMAYRDQPQAFGDTHLANGLPGANGVPDVLDEARHGLERVVARAGNGFRIGVPFIWRSNNLIYLVSTRS
jgi:hypothetical protein